MADRARTWENGPPSPTSTRSTVSPNQYHDRHSTVVPLGGPTSISRNARAFVPPLNQSSYTGTYLPGHPHPPTPIDRHAPAVRYVPLPHQEPQVANIMLPDGRYSSPEYANGNHSPTGRENRTLFFSNLSFKLDEKTFRDRLSKVAPGQVVDVKLNISRSKNRDSAVATFATAFAASEVQRALNGRMSDGRQLQVRWDREGGESSHGSASNSSNSSREREKRRRKEKQLKASTCRRELRNREEQQQQQAQQAAATNATTTAGGHSKSTSNSSSNTSDRHRAKGPTIVKGGLMERPSRQRHRRGDSDAEDEDTQVHEEDLVFRGRSGRVNDGEYFSYAHFSAHPTCGLDVQPLLIPNPAITEHCLYLHAITVD